ncbi:MAG: stage II sporulation protein D [Syntrophomonadaceae bacterium]|nr:stage II sporulation protein D [Syntrophomonadaceae bacterium]
MKKILLIVGLLLVFILSYLWRNSHVKPEKATEPYVKLYLHQKGEVMDLYLEDYIIGTVAAEMPASFALEALKAQAVCARTYAIKKIIDQHPYPRQADLSDDINCCQAFCDISTHNIGPDNLKRIKTAVKETRGEIMLYDSRPIDALYHSCCGGKTDNSWGGSVHLNYLKEVKCKYCTQSPHYYEKHHFPNSRLAALAGGKDKTLDIRILSTSPAGRANQISINGKKIWASDLRRKLNLPSQWLSFKVGPQQTEITTRGYGHGLGMCQYGANGMAKRGKSYEDILHHYYQDIQIYKLPY